MAKSKRKKAKAQQNKGVEKKFLIISLIVTLVLIALIYMGYSSSM